MPNQGIGSQMKDRDSSTRVTLAGGCHCGAVQFEIKTAPQITVQACNCSMCQLTGYLHLIVPSRDFQLNTDPAMLTEYTFNTEQAKHRFCKQCGIKSFYVPRSNPDGYSVNLRCLDLTPADSVSVEAFDGQNWEAHADRLTDLSR